MADTTILYVYLFGPLAAAAIFLIARQYWPSAWSQSLTLVSAEALRNWEEASERRKQGACSLEAEKHTLAEERERLWLTLDEKSPDDEPRFPYKG